MNFSTRKATPIPLDNIDELARHLIRLMPVLRCAMRVFMRRIRNGTVPHMPEVEVTARELDFRHASWFRVRKISPMGKSARALPWCNCWSTIFPSRNLAVAPSSDAPSVP